MAFPAALGAALAKARTLSGLGRALAGGSTRRNAGRSCCMASCAGCTGCTGIAAVLVLAVGAALLGAIPQVVGVGLGGESLCDLVPDTRCPSRVGDVVGAPMSCPGLHVSQGFGDTPWEHPHTGIDLVCPPATPVVAVVAGIFHQMKGAPIACTFPPGRSGGLGTYGELDAADKQFLYGHLNGFAVSDGAHVLAGQRIGYEGDTGCATGDHLHFEVVMAGRPVDPCSSLPAGYPDEHDPTGLRCWGSAWP